MALSQKHPGKMLVPWFNSQEWKLVNNLIFATNSTDIDKRRALEILQMWKLRTPKLPSAVEGTLIVLNVLLQEKDMISEDKLRMLYGASIMRFINLCGAVTDKQGTFFKTAKQNKLPDWLIYLRHDIAHEQIIPSMFMLRMGLEFCLNWLKDEYWVKHCVIVKDFIINVDPNDKVKTVVELYSQINVALHSGNIKYIQDFSELNPLIIEKLDALDIVEIDSDTNVDVNEVLNLLLQSMCAQDYKNLEDEIAEVIVTDGSIFATQVSHDENGRVKLLPDFVIIWQDLINMLYFKNMLGALIKKLLNLCNNIETFEHVKIIASLWLGELCKSLLLAKNVFNQYTNLSDSNILNRDTAASVIKQMLQKQNPELKACLELDFQLCGGIINEVSLLRLTALQNPQTYTLNFLKYFLQVCGCTEEYIKETESFVNNYLFPQTSSLQNLYELHTLEEFQTMVPNSIEITPMDTTDLAVEVVPNENIAQPNTPSMSLPQKRWRIVEDTSIFEGCPLGVLAYQTRETNPLLHQEVL